MTKIIQFPRRTREPELAQGALDKPVLLDQARAQLDAKGNALLAGLVKIVWVVTVLLWPLLKWIVSFDVVIQFGRMVYYWNTPGSHAGFTFLLHFAVLTALVYFVSLYKPNGL